MLVTIIFILFVHFIADFILQIKEPMKSKNNIPLFTHVVVYSLILLISSFCIFKSPELAWYFAILNGVLHYCVDYITSRLSSYMYSNGYMGTNQLPNISFWAVIGFDQFLHSLMLLFTLFYFMGWPY